MRDRLVELMRQAEFAYLDFSKMHPCEKSLKDFTADYLIANGVIVPPCNVGDSVYVVSHFNSGILERTVERIIVDKHGNVVDTGYAKINSENFGKKNVFLTKEEAEEALKRKGVGK